MVCAHTVLSHSSQPCALSVVESLPQESCSIGFGFSRNWLDWQTGSPPLEHIRQKAFLSDQQHFISTGLPAFQISIYLSYVGSVTPTNSVAALQFERQHILEAKL
jgi:hypothetical protein